MEQKTDLFTIDHPILDDLVEVLRRTLKINNDELPVMVELRNHVHESLNDYLLSIITQMEDEEMFLTVEKLIKEERSEQFWDILEQGLSRPKGDILAEYLANFDN